MWTAGILETLIARIDKVIENSIGLPTKDHLRGCEDTTGLDIRRSDNIGIPLRVPEHLVHNECHEIARPKSGLPVQESCEGYNPQEEDHMSSAKGSALSAMNQDGRLKLWKHDLLDGQTPTRIAQYRVISVAYNTMKVMKELMIR